MLLAVQVPPRYIHSYARMHRFLKVACCLAPLATLDLGVAPRGLAHYSVHCVASETSARRSTPPTPIPTTSTMTTTTTDHDYPASSRLLLLLLLHVAFVDGTEGFTLQTANTCFLPACLVLFRKAYVRISSFSSQVLRQFLKN